MRRVTVSLLLGLLAILVFAMPAGAGVTWCRADPIVRINGTEVQVWVMIPEQYQSAVTGPIDVAFQVPSGAKTAVVLTDSGFNGYGERVTFSGSTGSYLPDGSFFVSLVVKVPMKNQIASVPVLVEVVHPNGMKQYFAGNQYVVTALPRIYPIS